MTKTKTKTDVKKMRCGKCTKHLSAFLDGELAEPLARAVGAHVAACPRCAAQLARLRTLHDALDVLPQPELSLGFDGGFARKLKEAKDARSVQTSHSRPSWWRVPVFAAAAASEYE